MLPTTVKTAARTTGNRKNSGMRLILLAAA